jgi:hypothetical protein
LIPARINDDSQPVPLQGDAAARLERRLAKLSEAFSSEQAAANTPDAMAHYERAAHLAHAASRARSHRYFLRNAYRFPPRILAAQLLTYARNRLAERGLAGQA